MGGVQQAAYKRAAQALQTADRQNGSDSNQKYYGQDEEWGVHLPNAADVSARAAQSPSRPSMLFYY